MAIGRISSIPHTVIAPTSIAVIVPANNEQAYIGAALERINASRNALNFAEQTNVHIVVVCDGCEDDTVAIASELLCPKRDVLACCNFRNVGRTRAYGALLATQHRWNRLNQSADWYAFTDADSQVPEHWLKRQVSYCRAGVELVLGTVRLDSRECDLALLAQFECAYRSKVSSNDHFHIHGANLGVRADVYWQVGGFASLAAHEDVELVSRLARCGVRAVHDIELIVTTSARVSGRVPHGVSTDLLAMRTRLANAS